MPLLISDESVVTLSEKYETSRLGVVSQLQDGDYNQLCFGIFKKKAYTLCEETKKEEETVDEGSNRGFKFNGVFKIVLVGDRKTGKSTFVHRMFDWDFKGTYRGNRGYIIDTYVIFKYIRFLMFSKFIFYF